MADRNTFFTTGRRIVRGYAGAAELATLGIVLPQNLPVGTSIFGPDLIAAARYFKNDGYKEIILSALITVPAGASLTMGLVPAFNGAVPYPTMPANNMLTLAAGAGQVCALAFNRRSNTSASQIGAVAAVLGAPLLAGDFALRFTATVGASTLTLFEIMAFLE